MKWLPRGSVVKDPPANAGDVRDSGSILGLGRSPGEGNGNPLQYSCLENPMDRGDWRATCSHKDLDTTEELNNNECKSKIWNYNENLNLLLLSPEFFLLE